MSTEIKAYGAQDSKADLKQMTIERRDLNANDVKIDILYCGVCHSDIRWHVCYCRKFTITDDYQE